MFEKLISKVTQLLTENNIPYMIIGGQAVLLYGTPRLTRDIDITLGISIDELTEIETICNSADLLIIPDDHTDFVNKTHVLPVKDKATGIRVDLIFSFTSYEREAIERANKIKIDTTLVNFASVEDVIIHKIFAGRPRDIEDVRNVIIKNPDIDKQYIEKWLAEFDKTLDGADFSDSFKAILKDLNN
ncbi:MAG: nucleotidyltransferase [Nitrospirae bacterium]|nr:nucleotidyltransferase [Nitrospirota bacterium]